jgi:hypothetical protein
MCDNVKKLMTNGNGKCIAMENQYYQDIGVRVSICGFRVGDFIC